MHTFDTIFRRITFTSLRSKITAFLILCIVAGISSVAYGQTASIKERTMNAREQLRSYHYRMNALKQKGDSRSISSAPSEDGIRINAAAATSSTIFFYDNFEGGAHAWTTELYGGATDDIWHETSLNAGSPTRSWWPGVDNQLNYATGHRINTSMKSEPINLSGAVGPVTLLFAENFFTERGWDYCMVDVSTDGGANWSHLRGGYGSAPTGDSNGWIITSLDLTPYAGQTIALRFYFDTGDANFNDFPGWFVDDIVIFDQSGTITGKKFFDVNNNSVKDIGERGVKDWAITATGPVVFTTKTNYRGRYTLQLPLGSYSITEEFQPNWTQKYPLSGNWNVDLTTPDTLIDSLHFGNYTQASFINGMKFNDLNHDGVKDPGDTALAEWKIVLADTNGNEIGFDRTDSLGEYSLYVYQPGRYIVREVPKSGWVQSYPLSESYTIDIPDLNTVSNGNDFGNYFSPLTNSIIGQVIDDRNRNGLKDSLEEGVPGFTLKLFLYDTTSGDFHQVRKTTSDSSGYFEFLNRPAGTYQVAIVEPLPVGWWKSFPAVPYEFELNNGETVDSIDFGNYQIAPSSISGMKFNDLDSNGTKDSVDVGLGGWTVQLSGTTVYATSVSQSAVTDPDGNFSFTGLWPGSYTLSEVWKSNWRQTHPAFLLPYNFSVGPEQTISGKDFGNTVDSSFSIAFRTFLPESLALGVDAKHKHKPVKPVADKTEFTVVVVVDTIPTTGVEVYFAKEIDTTFPFTSTPSHPWTASDGKGKRFIFSWDSAASPPQGDPITIHGFAKGRAPQYISKYRILRPTPPKHPTWHKDGATLSNVLRYPMPNAINLVQAAGPGLRVGLGGPHSVLHKHYPDVQKSLLDRADAMHIGDPRCLDVFSGPTAKSIKKQQTYLKPTLHNNKLFAEAIALKMNIRGSDFGNMPGGFGNLIFDDGSGIGPAHPLNGLSIREIAAALDSFMSSYKDTGAILHQCTMPEILSGLSADTLFAKIRMIDSSFSGPIDTISFARGLIFKEVHPLTDVPFLRLNPSATNKMFLPEERITEIIPDRYTLYQNYPNPFNPTTQIEFYLPFQSMVTLKVYNMLGQEVATIFNNEIMDDGSQAAEFNAQNLPSGVYFYRITAQTLDDDGIQTGERFVTVKKMVLLK